MAPQLVLGVLLRPPGIRKEERHHLREQGPELEWERWDRLVQQLLDQPLSLLEEVVGKSEKNYCQNQGQSCYFYFFKFQAGIQGKANGDDSSK